MRLGARVKAPLLLLLLLLLRASAPASASASAAPALNAAEQLLADFESGPDLETAFPLDIEVTVDGAPRPLGVARGGSLREAVRAFCARHDVDCAEAGPLILRALLEEADAQSLAREQEAQRLQQLLLLDAVERAKVAGAQAPLVAGGSAAGGNRAADGFGEARDAIDSGSGASGGSGGGGGGGGAAAPVVRATVSVNVNSETYSCELFQGESPQEAARRFCARHGLVRDEEYDSVLRLLVNRLRAATGLRDGLPLTTDGARTLVSLDVNLADGTGRMLKLRVLEGETPAEAARGFLDRAGFDAADEAALTARAEAKLLAVVEAAEREQHQRELALLARVQEQRRSLLMREIAGEDGQGQGQTQAQPRGQEQEAVAAVAAEDEQQHASPPAAAVEGAAADFVIEAPDAAAAALRAAAEALPEGEGFVLSVNFDDGRGSLPLAFRYGELPEAAAAAFLRALGLQAHAKASTFAEQLAAGLRAREAALREEAAAAAVAEARRMAAEASEAAAAAAAAAEAAAQAVATAERELALAARAEAEGSDTASAEVRAVAEAASQPTSGTPAVEAAAPPAAELGALPVAGAGTEAAAEPEATAPRDLVLPLAFGRLNYDVELARGDSLIGASRNFCRLEWERLRPEMAAVLGEGEGAAAPSEALCGELVLGVVAAFAAAAPPMPPSLDAYGVNLSGTVSLPIVLGS
jgi:hypothetical protein